MSFLSANTLAPIVAGVLVVLFMAGLLFLMNWLAKRNLKKNGSDGSQPQSLAKPSAYAEETAPVGQENPDSCREKLRLLKGMYEEGLITEDEYGREKEALLKRFRESDK